MVPVARTFNTFDHHVIYLLESAAFNIVTLCAVVRSPFTTVVPLLPIDRSLNVPKYSKSKGKSLEVDTDGMTCETCCVSSDVDAVSDAACLPIGKACECVSGIEALDVSNFV